MSRRFHTHAYKFAHGRKPRGTGSWAFVPADYCWPDGDIPEDGIAWAWGTYTDAKHTVGKRYPKVTDWLVLS